MARNWLLGIAAAAALTSAAVSRIPLATVTADDDGVNKFWARLRSFDEVPSISSPAEGTFRARLQSDGLHYKLTYSGLTAPVTQAHIHFGQTHTAGGIMVWLCSGPTNVDPTGLAPTCPQEGAVEGVITESNIVQPGAPPPSQGQGIAAGEFDEFLRALGKGAGYANVHSQNFPSGEIRGQIN
jgi:hypothetical protein